MDRLGLGVAQQLVNSLFASEAAILVAAERGAIEVAGGAVDPDIAGLDRTRGPECGLKIVGEDRRSETILGRVGERQRLLLVAPAEDGQHGPEDLLARDAHIWLHVGKDCRLEPIAPLEILAGWTLAAGHQPRAFAAAGFDHRADALVV